MYKNIITRFLWTGMQSHFASSKVWLVCQAFCERLSRTKLYRRASTRVGLRRRPRHSRGNCTSSRSISRTRPRLWYFGLFGSIRIIFTELCCIIHRRNLKIREHFCFVHQIGSLGAARTVRAAGPGAGAGPLPSGARPPAFLFPRKSRASSRSRAVRLL